MCKKVDMFGVLVCLWVNVCIAVPYDPLLRLAVCTCLCFVYAASVLCVARSTDFCGSRLPLALPTYRTSAPFALSLPHATSRTDILPRVPHPLSPLPTGLLCLPPLSSLSARESRR
jgi:hypothetical protein